MADLGGVSEVNVGSDDVARREFSFTKWLFIDGNRLVVATVFLVGIYLLLLATTAVIGPVEQRQTTPLFYLFSVLGGGNFTLVTIVISVSQLVISRQLGTPGQIRNQIEATNQFRGTIEETSDVDVAPVTPTEFLHLLLRSAAENTKNLQQAAEGESGDEWDELVEIVDRLAGHVGRVEANIARSDVSVVSALAVTLDTNYSEDIYDLRSVRTRYAESYPAEVEDWLDALVVRLQQIDVGRQYLKTLYMQDELSMLSRSLLYVGIPALLTTVLMLRAFAAGFESFTALTLLAVVPLTVTVAFAPLLVLFAYVLRLTTVARWTLAITPFTVAMREDEGVLSDAD